MRVCGFSILLLDCHQNSAAKHHVMQMRVCAKRARGTQKGQAYRRHALQCPMSGLRQLADSGAHKGSSAPKHHAFVGCIALGQGHAWADADARDRT